MPTVLITGASRGLGLELVRQFGADGWRVVACARTPARAVELQGIAAAAPDRVTVHALDVVDHAQITALAQQLDRLPIDVRLSSAGTIGSESFADKGMTLQRFGHIDYDDWMRTLRVNVFGPIKMAEAFVEHVAASDQKKIITLTSVVGLASSMPRPAWPDCAA